MIWQWNNAVNKRNLQFSDGEKEIITREKTAAPIKELLEIKHMPERCVEIPLSKNNFIWLFYLPDFTRIFRDWYRMYLDSVFELYQPDARAILADKEKWVMLKYSGERPIQIISRLLASADYDSVSQLLKKADEAEEVCRIDLEFMKIDLRTGKLPLIPKKVVDSLNYFAAFALNNVYPDRYFHESFPFVDLNRLLTSKISSWKMLYDKSIEVLEPVYAGIHPEKRAVEKYSEEISFIRWVDICSTKEDTEYSLKMIENAKNFFQDYLSVWKYMEDWKEEKRLERMEDSARHNYVKKVLKEIPPAKKPLFGFMERMAAKAQRYNEMRRIMFTRSLKLIRTLCERQNIDWKTASLRELVEH